MFGGLRKEPKPAPRAHFSSRGTQPSHQQRPSFGVQAQETDGPFCKKKTPNRTKDDITPPEKTQDSQQEQNTKKKWIKWKEM